MSMYKWLKWLNYVSAFGENEGHSADGSEILHRVSLENIPFFHPKKPRGTPKKSHSSSKVFSSKPISFSAAVSLRFIFFSRISEPWWDDDFPSWKSVCWLMGPQLMRISPIGEV